MDPMEYSDHSAIAEKLLKLRRDVETAQEQATMAVMFYETWHPTINDAELLKRMGTSYATQSFLIVQWSLRREMILALMRIWDSNKKSLRLTIIREELRDKVFFNALAKDRARRIDFDRPNVVDQIAEKLDEKRQLVLSLISKYMEGGSGYETMEKVRCLRNERLAHRQIEPPKIGIDPTNEEIGGFYLDTLELVSLLLELVNGVVFDMNDASGVYKFHARHFWASVRGERTEGHPNYRPALD
jgi:hypothetical protein